MLYVIEHTEDMDVTALTEYVQEVIDFTSLGEKLQHEPIVQEAGGSWRPLSREEALKVARLVGEAIGARLVQPPS